MVAKVLFSPGRVVYYKGGATVLEAFLAQFGARSMYGSDLCGYDSRVELRSKATFK